MTETCTQSANGRTQPRGSRFLSVPAATVSKEDFVSLTGRGFAAPVRPGQRPRPARQMTPISCSLSNKPTKPPAPPEPSTMPVNSLSTL